MPKLTPAPFECIFALIDVKRGRKRLAKRLYGDTPVHVMILGTLQPGKPWSTDDGVSIEFAVDVQSISEIEP